MKKLIVISFLFGMYISMIGQVPPPKDLNTKMGDEATVVEFIETVDWQQKRPLTKDDLERLNALNGYIIDWATNTKLFTLDLNQYIISEDCWDCTVCYIGNAGTFDLHNKNADENSIVNAGMEAMISFYNVNKKVLGKSNFMEKMINIQDSCEMPLYIENAMVNLH